MLWANTVFPGVCVSSDTQAEVKVGAPPPPIALPQSLLHESQQLTKIQESDEQA